MFIFLHQLVYLIKCKILLVLFFLKNFRQNMLIVSPLELTPAVKHSVWKQTLMSYEILITALIFCLLHKQTHFHEDI